MKGRILIILIVGLPFTCANSRFQRQDSIIFPADEVSTRISNDCKAQPSLVCLPLSQCREYSEKLANPTQGNLQAIRQALCAYGLNEPKVCCGTPAASLGPPKQGPEIQQNQQQLVPNAQGGSGFSGPPQNFPLGLPPGGGLSIIDEAQKDDLPKICGIRKGSSWPWLALVGDRDRKGWFCGGSLITARHILTAAHCVDGTAQRFQVKLGGTKVEDDADGEIIRVLRVVSHPSYKRDNDYVKNDLAILVLDQSVDFSDKVAPICVRGGGSQGGDAEMLPQVAGWGIQFFDKPKSNKAVSAKVSTRPASECLPPGSKDTNVICSLQKEAACKADGGGPLFIEDGGIHVEIGVVTLTSPCDNSTSPMLYTKLSEYQPWIINNLL